jgi:signal transduction histidine kinase
MLRLVVEDQGIGFDEKYLDRIFTVFQRLHSRAEYEGTGVGLAICRKIAQRHGGDITAKSAPGLGASFLVTLPYRHANAATATAVAEPCVQRTNSISTYGERETS